MEKSGKGLFIAFILSILIIIGLIVYIFYDKGFLFTSDNQEAENPIQENNEQQEEQDSSEDNSISQLPKCYGTYYGEYQSANDSGQTYNLQYTYILNDDGTFTAHFGQGSSTTGFFAIHDNTISFIRAKDTVGPRDQDPRYYTDDYVIDDDCSSILLDNENNFRLYRQ